MIIIKLKRTSCGIRKSVIAAAKELTAEDIKGLGETEELFKNNLSNCSVLLLMVVVNDESLPRLQLDSIMQHDQSVYDAVICLRPMYCARLQESLATISHPPSTLPRVREQYKNMVNGTKADRILTGLEGLGFDPLKQFLREINSTVWSESYVLLQSIW